MMNIEHFNKLASLQEKAKYLLQFEITTRLAIENLTPVTKAYIGDIGLPITSEGNEGEAEVIAKAKQWLEAKAI